MQTKNGRVYTIYTCMHILQQNQRGKKKHPHQPYNHFSQDSYSSVRKFQPKPFILTLSFPRKTRIKTRQGEVTFSFHAPHLWNKLLNS